MGCAGTKERDEETEIPTNGLVSYACQLNEQQLGKANVRASSIYQAKELGSPRPSSLEALKKTRSINALGEPEMPRSLRPAARGKRKLVRQWRRDGTASKQPFVPLVMARRRARRVCGRRERQHWNAHASRRDACCAWLLGGQDQPRQRRRGARCRRRARTYASARSCVRVRVCVRVLVYACART
eukprot:3717339-Pleurochrysis_carterae.AAC.2